MEYHVGTMMKVDEIKLPAGVTVPEARGAEGVKNQAASLSFDSLSKTYRTKERVVSAVAGVTLSVPAGRVVALLGPNGAGKTTLIKMLCGLVTPDSGSVFLNGVNLKQSPIARRHLGLVLEGSRDFYELLTVFENLRYFATLMAVAEADRARRIDFVVEQFSLKEQFKVQARHLSKGQKQRLSLALSLVHQPRFLVLDEPTLGLDPGAVDALSKLLSDLRREGTGILLASHDLLVVEDIADSLAILNRGTLQHTEVVRDPINASRTTERSIREIYRAHLE